jgi:hypothetical protein
MAERSSLLFEISKYLGDRVISIPSLRRARPDIGRLYPRMGLVELEEILERLKGGDSFSTPAIPPKISDRNLKIYQMRLEGMSFAAIGRAQTPPISKQMVAKICNRVAEIQRAGVEPA